MSDRETVLFANAAFYAAFVSRDMIAMARVWADGDDIGCVHPGWPPLKGRTAVMTSWRNILTGPSPPNISFRRPTVAIHGSLAIVTCVEEIAGEGRPQHLVATNIFTRAGRPGEWRLVHHHGSPANIDPSDLEGDEPPPMN
jgi:ketosteroid isomerase-like protein